MLTTASHIATCLSLTKAISKSRTVEDIYSAALDALSSVWVSIAHRFFCSIPTGSCDSRRIADFRTTIAARSKATPWQPDSPDPQSIWVSDVADGLVACGISAHVCGRGNRGPGVYSAGEPGPRHREFMLYYARRPTPVPMFFSSPASCRPGGVCRRAHPNRRTSPKKRGTPPLRARRRVHGNVGLGSLHEPGAVVRQPGVSSWPLPEAHLTGRLPATSARFIPTTANVCSRRFTRH